MTTTTTTIKKMAAQHYWRGSNASHMALEIRAAIDQRIADATSRNALKRLREELITKKVELSGVAHQSDGDQIRVALKDKVRIINSMLHNR